MYKLVKEVKFISHTINSFTLNCDGKKKIFTKNNTSKCKSIGGMWTKLKAAYICVSNGIPVVICKG